MKGSYFSLIITYLLFNIIFISASPYVRSCMPELQNFFYSEICAFSKPDYELYTIIKAF